MKEVKLSARKHPVKLPPQQSAVDTSNWDTRNVSAPSVDKITKKRTRRNVSFQKSKDTGIPLAQALKILERQKAKRKH